VEAKPGVPAWETVAVADGLVLTRRESEWGTHEMVQRAAAGPGRRVVHEYVGYEEWDGAGFLRRETARHGVALILGFGDDMDVYESEVGSPKRRLSAFVVGNQMRSSMTGVAGHQLGVQVELSAQGAAALFGDVSELHDAVLTIEEAFGVAGDRLLERLAESPSWAARLDLLDHEFGRLGSSSDSGADVKIGGALSPEVDWLRRQLAASHGALPVEPLMDETGWSRRHVTERFRRQLGASPKAYARLLRFEHVSALLSALPSTPGRTVADVAIDAGYYDQSHLTRDFTAMGGMTPGAFVATMDLVPEVRFVQDAGLPKSSESVS
jgi:AraC-like DNA-binding protein